MVVKYMSQVIDEPTRSGSTSHVEWDMDSISNISPGMIVTAVSSGSVSGTALVSSAKIASNNKPNIIVAGLQTWADNTTLTLKAAGSNLIKDVDGLELEFKDLKLVPTQITALVRGAISSSRTITVSGTYGISKGAYIEGFGVDNSSDNPVTGISASSSTGEIVMTTAQTLTDKTVLKVIGSAMVYTITGTITIKKFPSSNATVYLNLDNLLTRGAGS